MSGLIPISAGDGDEQEIISNHWGGSYLGDEYCAVCTLGAVRDLMKGKRLTLRNVMFRRRS